MARVRFTWNCGFLTGRYFEIAFHNRPLCDFCRHVREPPRYQMRVASVRMDPLIKAVPMTDLPGVDHVPRIGGILTLARVAWRLDDTDTIKIIR